MAITNGIEEVLRNSRTRFAAEYGVTRLGIFGSYAKGTATANSDVDLIVEFERPLGLRFIDFAEELERLLNKKVDILTPDGLKGIRVRRVADDIAKSILYV